MEITLFSKNLTAEEEQVFTEYFSQKTDAIQNLLGNFSRDAKLLKVSVEKFSKHDAFEVELYLILPNKSIVAREASHTLAKAIDLSKDRLVNQIKKHIAQLRRGREHRSIKKHQTVVVPDHELID